MFENTVALQDNLSMLDKLGMRVMACERSNLMPPVVALLLFEVKGCCEPSRC